MKIIQRQWLLAFILAYGTTSALAQQAVNPGNGKTVKRITFDREHVTVTYDDGTQDDGVQSLTLHSHDDGTATGISDIAPSSPTPREEERSYYTLDGRRVNGQLPKGVYIERTGNQVRKTVKK